MAAGTWQPSHMAVRKGNGKVGNVNWTKRAFVQSFGEAICCKRGSLTGFMKWACKGCVHDNHWQHITHMMASSLSASSAPERAR
eukprot:1156593-Pelagomonas_calceolata.AAC.6